MAYRKVRFSILDISEYLRVDLRRGISRIKKKKKKERERGILVERFVVMIALGFRLRSNVRMYCVALGIR